VTKFGIDSHLQWSSGRNRNVVSQFFQDDVPAVHAISQWRLFRDPPA
jgi:hypothetical protein